MRAVATLGGVGVGAMLVLVAPCTQPLGAQQPSAAPASAARAIGPLADSLRAFGMNMAALLRARDAEAVIALYGDPAHFVHVEEGVVIPWAQLERMMRTYFATNTTNPVRVIGEPGVTLIDRNAAVVYVTHTTEGRADRAAHEGVWTGVLRREPGGWKIVHSHSSDRRNQRGERIQD